MSTKKILFKNQNGETLAARLDTPDFMEPHNYALFAHCFTCTKNLSAVRNIARALNNEGIAVLRFDFTGLGQSEGDFANTNFSSNVQDLIDAANYLEQEFKAPSLIIGHSLGGTAAIYAASQLPGVRAVATIGAPSSPAHVEQLIESGLDEIEKNGFANISIGGRPFTIKKQFIDDLNDKNLLEVLKSMRIPIAVFHSPQDTIVEIQNAKEIYEASHHPKSIISLDGADHLLSENRDSKYVGNVIAGWVTRYIDLPEIKPITTNHQVAVSIGNDGYTSDIVAGKHQLVADEPASVGGKDFGPSPYDYLSAGLGACTTMTLRMYADRKQWDLQKVVVHINHGKDYCEDCEDVESGTRKIDHFIREIEIQGDLTASQIQKLLIIADKCPVHRTL